MFFRKKVNCPSCQGSRCRESRWLSLEEKQAHPGSCPYRCLDCSFRFLAKKGADFSTGLVVSVPAALLAITLAIFATFWLMRSDSPSVLGTPTASSALGPEVMQAAEAGDAGAQFRVGEALLQDPARNAETSANAVRWLQMSAENGNTEAMIFLGRLSRTGVGILQNFGQSAKWIQTAATRGNPEGMLELGRLYRDGVGVEKDLVRAYVWFNRASAARNLDAVREREAIARVLTPEELKAAQNQSSAHDSDGEKPADKGAPR
jgi:hypothetical protein